MNNLIVYNVGKNRYRTTAKRRVSNCQTNLVHRDSRHPLSRASRFSLDRERWRQLREGDGGRKMAVEKARERNKKGQEEGREGRWWRVTLSFRYELPGRNEAEGEASNSSWNLGNARGPKSFRCSTGRKNVSVSAIKGFESFYGKFKVASPRQNYYAYLVYMHEERCWNLFFNLRIIFVKTFETG